MTVILFTLLTLTYGYKNMSKLAVTLFKGSASGPLLNSPSLQLSHQSGADVCVGVGCCAALVPTSRTLSQPSITGGPLISLLFCHANYSRLVKRPPNALNDRESIERGQMAGGEESQSLRAE